MNRRVRKGFMLSFVLLCLWALSASAQTDPKKITVRVPGAAIHARADSSSEVIEKPSVGAVYEVVRKTGTWYEIRLPSSLGMVITGFIHEKFLNIEKPIAEPKKDILQIPVKQMTTQPPRTKTVNISLAGLYHRQMGYDYEYAFRAYDEPGAVYDSADDRNMFGFHLGLGFLVSENLEISLGVDYVAATLEGKYALDMPSDSFYNRIAHAEAPLDHKFSDMAFKLGLNYHLLKEGQVRPYLGGGVSYIKGTMELLQDFSYASYHVPDTVHVVEIESPKLSSKTVGTLGFYGKAGVDIAVSEAVSVFCEGQYLYAKKEVPHPFGTMVTGSDDPVEINLGGISVLFGVKIRL